MFHHMKVLAAIILVKPSGFLSNYILEVQQRSISRSAFRIDMPEIILVKLSGFLSNCILEVWQRSISMTAFKIDMTTVGRTNAFA